MLLSFSFVVILAFIHIFAYKISKLHIVSRKKWLSFAGGIAVSFVFVHILPELHKWQSSLQQKEKVPLDVENYLYMIALVGVLLFFGLEKAIILLKEKKESEKRAIEEGAFWWHISVFAVYNLLIGYLFLYDQGFNGANSFFIFIALGFHFLGNDYSLFNHHEETYKKTGRWIMASSVLIGWFIGFFTKLPDIVFSALFAFIAGGIVLNALKEEIPAEKENHFGAFFLGAVIFSIMLLM